VFGHLACGAPIQDITIDGSFGDWGAVPVYIEYLNDENQDYHGDAPPPLSENPQYPDHADVDILEYKFTHDENNLYAYFRGRGVIGNTQQEGQGNGRAGRYYVIITIDVDNNDSTGYELGEGGYWIYPDWQSSGGYDMNFELEFYNGSWNTGHYLSHDALSDSAEAQDIYALTSGQWNGNYESGPYTPGFVQPAPGNYDNYTQWVYHANDTLTLVRDRGPVVPGIMSMALSPDGHEVEIRAPFKGFLNNASGQPNMALGKTIDIAFSLEHSGEMVARPSDPDYPVDWASDTAAPINGYFLGAYLPSGNIIDDFEANEGHFGWAYNTAQETFGLSATTTIDRVTTQHQGVGGSSQLLNLVIDAAPPNTWQLRHDSGIGTPADPAGNTALDATGYVGFWLKTDESGISVRIGIDDPGGTGTNALELGFSQPVIGDNEWHLYQWNLENANHWNAFSGGANGQIDAVSGAITIDSIFFNGAGNAQVYLDSVSHNPFGMVASAYFAGDYNGNGVVDSSDYNDWRKSFGDTVAIGTKADGNYNGVIDIGDYIVWRQQLSAGSGAGAEDATAIPEPAGSLLAALGFVVALACGRRAEVRC
jgi:hypothetical protein